jgi:hypothetical protein
MNNPPMYAYTRVFEALLVGAVGGSCGFSSGTGSLCALDAGVTFAFAARY